MPNLELFLTYSWIAILEQFTILSNTNVGRIYSTRIAYSIFVGKSTWI